MENGPRKGKAIRRVALFILVALVTFFAGRYLLYTKIKNSIAQELTSLQQDGIYVKYANLEVDPWLGSLEVYDLDVKVRKDSLGEKSNHGLQAFLPFVEISGVELIPYIRSRTLSIRRISSSETNITYCAGATLFRQQRDSLKRKIELKNISVATVSLPEIDLHITEHPTDDTIAHVLTNVDVKDLELSEQLDSLVWNNGQIHVTDLAMNYMRELYGIAIEKIHLDIAERTINMDSLYVKPVLPRTAFMRAKGKQIDYIEARVPSMIIRNVDWYTFPQPTLQIDRIDLSVITSLYRDKRLPFNQPEVLNLPSHALQRLWLKLKVDTLLLKDSYVRYEEMPELGDSTGTIYFQDLNATIVNIHNDKKLKVDGKMHATAKFMGAGDLEAFFTFPYDTLRPYKVAGTLTNMPMVRVNNMLGAAAQIKVQSGTMQNLKFNFSYNKTKSTGSVELNYEDLKVLTLRENRNNEQSVDLVKTILLNAFIVRKDMNENVNDEKRRGEIEYYRNEHKSVFNYWWKSILSGIKSAYKLDKLSIKASQDKEKKPKKKRKSIKEIWSRIFD